MQARFKGLSSEEEGGLQAASSDFSEKSHDLVVGSYQDRLPKLPALPFSVSAAHPHPPKPNTPFSKLTTPQTL